MVMLLIRASSLFIWLTRSSTQCHATELFFHFQSPKQSIQCFTMIPQSSTHVRISYRNQYPCCGLAFVIGNGAIHIGIRAINIGHGASHIRKWAIHFVILGKGPFTIVMGPFTLGLETFILGILHAKRPNL